MIEYYLLFYLKVARRRECLTTVCRLSGHHYGHFQAYCFSLSDFNSITSSLGMDEKERGYNSCIPLPGTIDPAASNRCVIVPFSAVLSPSCGVSDKLSLSTIGFCWKGLASNATATASTFPHGAGGMAFLMGSLWYLIRLKYFGGIWTLVSLCRDRRCWRSVGVVVSTSKF